MPTLIVDGRTVEAAEGASVLDVCRKLGVEIPTMCFLEGYERFTSCMVCVVKDVRLDRLIPACSARVTEGMIIETDGEEVRDGRRVALELLLSDHVGDCEGPCRRACPAGMNIPLMIRQLARGDVAAAAATVWRDIALPRTLGRICPAPCEKVCRRRGHDEAVSICLLKRFAGDHAPAVAGDDRETSGSADGSPRPVAVVGAGPAGLAAAAELRRLGRSCTLFEAAGRAGGELRKSVEPGRLPRDVLDAEIDGILAMGVVLETGCVLGGDLALDDLLRRFGAVIVATGFAPADSPPEFGLAVGQRGIEVERGTYRTSRTGVFAGGGAAGRGRRLAVRACADGKEMARAADRHVRGATVVGAPAAFNSAIGPVSPEDIGEFLEGASGAARVLPGSSAEGFSREEMQREARRCLRCDCRKPVSCLLRRYADRYGASQRRYQGAERRPVRIVREHGNVVYEPGKCVKCGRCVRITESEHEAVGLTFVGRGFDIHVGAPFDEPLARALTRTAARCVTACPTGALAWKDGEDQALEEGGES